MTDFTPKEIREIQKISNDLFMNAVRYQEIIQDENKTDYNNAYKNILNISISLSVQTLYNKTNTNTGF